jgi:CheY-like chemotaxis protein
MPDQFDLVITDMTMPGLTGGHLATEIMSTRADMPIILCTGYSDLISEAKASAMGIRGLVLKPTGIKTLAQAIRKALDKGKTDASSCGRILVVDDEDQMRTMIRQMLEKSGYEVTEARNGREAICRYRERPSDVVITDLIMPEKEGIETIMEFRHEHPDVKIIAISG